MRLQSVEQQGREGEGHVRRGYGEGLNLGVVPWRLSHRGEPGVEENTHTGKWGQLLRLAPPSSLIQDVTVCQALRGPGGQRGAPALQEGRPWETKPPQTGCVRAAWGVSRLPHPPPDTLAASRCLPGTGGVDPEDVTGLPRAENRERRDKGGARSCFQQQVLTAIPQRAKSANATQSSPKGMVCGVLTSSGLNLPSEGTEAAVQPDPGAGGQVRQLPCPVEARPPARFPLKHPASAASWLPAAGPRLPEPLGQSWPGGRRSEPPPGPGAQTRGCSDVGHGAVVTLSRGTGASSTCCWELRTKGSFC